METLLDEKGYPTKYQYEVKPGESIRIRVEENRITREPGKPGFVRKPVTFEREFVIGDIAEMYNGDLGTITKIEENRIQILRDNRTSRFNRPRWYSIKAFLELNYDFVF